MYHLCNHSNLIKLIIEDPYYYFDTDRGNTMVHDPDIAETLSYNSIYKDIQNEINRQGYSIFKNIEKKEKVFSNYKLYQRLLVHIQELKAKYINDDDEYHTKEDEQSIMTWTDFEAKNTYRKLYANIFTYNESDYMSRTCCFCIKNRTNNDGQLDCFYCEYAMNRDGISCSTRGSYYATHILHYSISNKILRSFIDQAKKDLGIMKESMEGEDE